VWASEKLAGESTPSSSLSSLPYPGASKILWHVLCDLYSGTFISASASGSFSDIAEMEKMQTQSTFLYYVCTPHFNMFSNSGHPTRKSNFYIDVNKIPINTMPITCPPETWWRELIGPFRKLVLQIGELSSVWKSINFHKRQQRTCRRSLQVSRSYFGIPSSSACSPPCLGNHWMEVSCYDRLSFL
jgi:hypothetical protein